MIKVIAFDLVGVLVREKDLDLTPEENKIERMFGPNKSDAEFMIAAREIISNDSLLMRTTENLINKLYEVREPALFQMLKEKYSDIKIIIATNHVSCVRNYIGEAFGIDYLDGLFISAEMNKIKPNVEFYEQVLDYLNINAEDMLFLDDSRLNIDGAKELGINTIKIERDTKAFETIVSWLEIYK